MLSIVQKPGDVEAGTLTVRGRVAGDIEAVFPGAKVIDGGGTDYAYRARIDREQIAQAIADQVRGIRYANFKATVKNSARHDAYLDTWQAMMQFQEGRR